MGNVAFSVGSTLPYQKLPYTQPCKLSKPALWLEPTWTNENLSSGQAIAVEKSTFPNNASKTVILLDAQDNAY